MKSTTWLAAMRQCRDMASEQAKVLEDLLRSDDRPATEAAARKLGQIHNISTLMAETMALRCDGHPRADAETWIEEKFLELVTGLTSADVDPYGDGPHGPQIRRNGGEFNLD